MIMQHKRTHDLRMIIEFNDPEIFLWANHRITDLKDLVHSCFKYQ